MPAPDGQAFAIPPGATIGSLLRHPPLDALEARILLSHALQLSRAQLVTQSERVLASGEIEHIQSLFRRRIAGEPVAYILGEREFFGLLLQTTPDVLIPRPETELLVELALDLLPHGGSVLDMGTGSGAIAIAIGNARREATVTALDASEAALAVARRNALRHAVAVRFLHSDWYAALGEERFDLIVSNPPYIVAGDPHLSQGDLRFEPADALTDHADGLNAIRTIVAGAARHLEAGGWLLMEHGYDQADAVRELLVRQGFHDVQSWKDLAGIERATGGRK
ncbi:MAG TPA: peptide chain release factor N(5)-glutamine methyltransferase [Noviherbaspirillum sp.]|uniref:peptide chain release factor N(5)-glutamine methyltransferase n=1 Tax=Noviherbaspirillum sp. TaxID=1926288 RepID=UPI002D4587BD|nr:peptide chain release factor N(5)-glutamine methyltransferase [Noviherbaspirillum sp.]HYD94214.1 peptide chain release factor N(5)-glutamine methyltransferase [Noviherbaspirillum sp.]